MLHCQYLAKQAQGQNVLQSVNIDSAAYLLKIISPDFDNVAMSLYNIINPIDGVAKRLLSLVVGDFHKRTLSDATQIDALHTTLLNKAAVSY